MSRKALEGAGPHEAWAACLLRPKPCIAPAHLFTTVTTSAFAAVASALGLCTLDTGRKLGCAEFWFGG